MLETGFLSIGFLGLGWFCPNIICYGESLHRRRGPLKMSGFTLLRLGRAGILIRILRVRVFCP